MRILLGQATTVSMSQIETDREISIKSMILALDTRTHLLFINIINCTILVITKFTSSIAHTGDCHLCATKSCIGEGKRGKQDLLLLILRFAAYCLWHFIVSKVYQGANNFITTTRHVLSFVFCIYFCLIYFEHEFPVLLHQ